MVSKVNKIDVRDDSRVEKRTALLNGRTYSYLYGVPSSGQYKATLFLLHGFPDLAMGWRYQIPFLLRLGFRIVAPDCLGYGRTDAPNDPEEYAHKKLTEDIKELASQLGESKIVLVGHDWGAALVYRVALWQRDLVSHIISVCVPYSPPAKKYISLEEVAKIRPHWGYQLHFASGQLEKVIKTKDDIRQFLVAMYGGRTPDRKSGIDVTKGLILDVLPDLKPSRLLSQEEQDFYVDEWARHGVHGPLNWYRLTQVNFKDERPLLSHPTIDVPCLFIQALKDEALPPGLGKSMAKWVPQLTVDQVNTNHWALWEDPKGVNDILGRWLGRFFTLDERRSKL